MEDLERRAEWDITRSFPRGKLRGTRLAKYGTVPSSSDPPLVSSQSEQAINEAVRECLARCASGQTPLGVMAEYIGELRDAGWEAEDIRTVEVTSRKVLAGIVSGTTQPKLN